MEILIEALYDFDELCVLEDKLLLSFSDAIKFIGKGCKLSVRSFLKE